MGREIRRVPPNWEHPKDEKGVYKVMFDRSYEAEKQEWIDGLLLWLDGKHEYQPCEGEYWEYCGNPPDREYYHEPWDESEATWYQAYENVSEGTPITPPFETKEKLIQFLCTEKDFWNQGPYSREAAERFVNGGYVPSMVIAGGVMYRGIDAGNLPRETTQ